MENKDNIKMYILYKKIHVKELIYNIYSFYKHPRLNKDLKTIIEVEGTKQRLHKIQNELEKEKDEWERQMIEIENNIILNREIIKYPEVPMFYKTLRKNTTHYERIKMCEKLLNCNCCDRHNEYLPDLEFIFEIDINNENNESNKNNKILKCCMNCPYEKHVEYLERDGNIYYKKCNCSCRHYIRELYHLICLDTY